MNAIQTKMSELLEAIVREAKTRSFEEFNRELKRQRQTISDLKESIGMIQRQLRNADVNLTPHPTIRTSPRDIRNFRRKLGITQKVFAQILQVNISTVIRWEKNLITPHARHRNKIRTLKGMGPAELEKLILQAKTALYE